MEKSVLEFDQQQIFALNHCLEDCIAIIDKQRHVLNKRQREQQGQNKKTIQRK